MKQWLQAVLLALALSGLVASCVVESPPLTPTEGTAGEPGNPPAANSEDAEASISRAIFDMVNDERRERGLGPLRWDDQLAGLARDWNVKMAGDGRLHHQDAQAMLENSQGFRAVGENIFRATAGVPAATIHIGWMKSDGHRRNVLQDGFNRLGVGVLCAEGGQVWATQRFGRTVDADRPAMDDELPPEEPIVTSPGEGPSCPGGPPGIDVEWGGTGIG